MQLAHLPLTPAIEPVMDSFVSMNLGSTLVLKACGFLEAQRGTLLDVSESSLRIKIGASWLERLLRSGANSKPIEVSLTLRDLERDDYPRVNSSLPPTCYSAVGVTIRPLSRDWTPEAFHEASHRLIWSLRCHFMACC